MVLKYAFLTMALAAASTSTEAAETLRAGMPTTPFYIVKSPAGQTDNLFEIITSPKGFMVSFARSVGSIPPFTLYTQRFYPNGKPIGTPVAIDGPGTIGDRVKMDAIGPTTAVATWMAGGEVKIAKISLLTGRASGGKLIGKSDDHIHDVAVLPNGNIAVVTPQIAPLPLPGKYKVALKVLSPAFGTVRDWTTVNGSGFTMDAWAYLDQTVVSRGTGGTVLYRDHGTNKIMGRNFGPTGSLGTTVTVSSQPFTSFFVQDIAYFEIKAARLDNGSVAACYTASTNRSGGRYTVRCRMLNALGRPFGPEINPSSAKGSQFSPRVVALPGNRFTVLWTQQDIVFPNAVKFRTYDAKGKPLTAAEDGAVLTTLHASPMETAATLNRDGSIVTAIGPEFANPFVPGIMGFGIPDPIP